MSRMSWLSFGRPITERTVLVALVAGFGVVMLLLGAAGVVAVREGRAIRGSVADLVREQVSITRLLHEAQVEEDALALVLQRVTGGAGKEEKLQQVHALQCSNRNTNRVGLCGRVEVVALALHYRERSLAHRRAGCGVP